MAKALTKRYPLLKKNNIVLGISWSKNLLQRIGFVRRKATTGKGTILVAGQKEAELKFMHKIVNQVEKHQIPPLMVILIKLHENTY